MSFDERDVRVGVDVFGADGIYLGTVVRVRWETPPPDPLPIAMERGSTERGGKAAFSGEGLGPVPTAVLGNDGPANQTKSTRYASLADTPPWAARRQPAELLIFRWLVSSNWATARPRLRRIPARLIQVVSLERIVLSVTEGELGRRRAN